MLRQALLASLLYLQIFEVRPRLGHDINCSLRLLSNRLGTRPKLNMQCLYLFIYLLVYNITAAIYKKVS